MHVSQHTKRKREKEKKNLPTQHAAWNRTQVWAGQSGEARLGFTVHAGVVHQDDLLEENGWRGVQDTVYRPQQSAPGLIVKHDYHTGGRQGGASLESLLNTSAATRGGGRGEHKDLTVLYSSSEMLWSSYYMCRPSPVGCPFHLWQRMCGSPFEISAPPEWEINLYFTSLG